MERPAQLDGRYTRKTGASQLFLFPLPNNANTRESWSTVRPPTSRVLRRVSDLAPAQVEKFDKPLLANGVYASNEETARKTAAKRESYVFTRGTRALPHHVTAIKA